MYYKSMKSNFLMNFLIICVNVSGFVSTYGKLFGNIIVLLLPNAISLLQCNAIDRPKWKS